MQRLPINLAEYEEAARAVLPESYFDYVFGGAADEVTLRENRAAFERIWLRPRVLVDVETIDTRTSLLGIPISFPVMLAPTGVHKLYHARGELATARAAHSMGTICTVGTFSNYSIGQIREQSNGPVFFQLYAFRDAGLNKHMVDQAVAAGAGALMLTLDNPRTGRRERDMHNQFALPDDLTPGHLAGIDIDYAGTESDQSRLGMLRADHLRSRSLTWKDLEAFRALAPNIPLMLKGILTAEDALLAVEYGVDAICVSNHGGRQLDTAIPTVEALPEIAQAVAGRIPIVLDGGIRRGTDVIKAIALGSTAVMLGRPMVWGLAVNGESGVRHVLELLREEFSLAMTLCGRTSVKDIDPTLVKIR